MSVSRTWVYGICWGLGLVFLAAPHVTFEDYWSRAAGQRIIRVGQVAAMLAILLGLTQLGVDRVGRAGRLFVRTRRGLLFSAFFLGALLTSLLRWGEVESLANLFATVGLFVAARAFWQLPDQVVRGSLRFAGLGLLSLVVVAVALHGLPETRTVGGVQPNIFAKIGFVGAVLLVLAGRGFGWAWLAVALASALLVNSRGGIVAILMFVGIKTCLLLGRNLTRLRLVGIAALSLAMVASATPMVIGNRGPVGWVVEEVFRADDPTRGLGTGLTGRADRWVVALERIGENPVLGYGYQMSAEVIQDEYQLREIGQSGAHSGFLNLALDVGLPLSLLWCVLLVDVMFDQGRRALSGSVNEDKAAQHASILGFLAASVFFWAIEPVYLSIGHIFGLSFILVFSYSLFSEGLPGGAGEAAVLLKEAPP